jgi:hypothetical protein
LFTRISSRPKFARGLFDEAQRKIPGLLHRPDQQAAAAFLRDKLTVTSASFCSSGK